MRDGYLRDAFWPHVTGRQVDTGSEYLARMARLRGELAIIGTLPARDLPARRAVEWLEALAETLQKIDLIEEMSDVIPASGDHGSPMHD